jgi:hypothetical protein
MALLRKNRSCDVNYFHSEPLTNVIGEQRMRRGYVTVIEPDLR